jgi:hypothetical protein
MKNEIDIINSVNEFYNSAWEKLIIVGTIALTIIGILVPLIIQWYQKKTMILNEEKLKNHIKQEVEKIKDDLRKEIKETFENEMKKFEEKIEKIRSNSEAGIFHIQAISELDKKLYLESLRSFITAATFYVDAEDYFNLQIVLEVIEDSCLKNITKSQYENIKLTRGCTLENLYEKIHPVDTKGAFTHIINKIKLKANNLQ